MPTAVRQRFNLTIGLAPKKFVWFRIAKCGTRSTLAALREYVTDFDIEQGFKIRYSSEQYSDYFKFTFVRDPYSRIVSAWNDKILLGNSGGGKFDSDLVNRIQDFRFFVDWLIDQDPKTVNIHFRPQALLVSEEVDFVGRMENFNEDLPNVLKEIGISPLHKVPHRNRKNLSRKEILGSGRVLNAITDYYSLDFERFDYTIR